MPNSTFKSSTSNFYKKMPEIRKYEATNVQIECHPFAIKAWQCWRALNRQFQLQNLAVNTQQLLQEVEPLHVIRTSNRMNFKFISGFPSARLISGGDIESVYFSIHEKLTKGDIERLSWGGVIKAMTYDLDLNLGLGSFYQAINQHMPAGLRQEFFGGKTLSRERLSTLCGTPAGAIRWQTDQLQTLSGKEITILEKITGSKK